MEKCLRFKPKDDYDLFEHLASINDKDWKTLFDLIPEIEEAKEFGTIEGGNETRPGVIQIPYSLPSPLVCRFEKLVYDIGLVVDFNWSKWEESQDLFSPDNPEIDKIDAITAVNTV